MGVLKKGPSIFAIILMMASVVGYTGLTLLSPSTYSYRGTQAVRAGSVLYIPLPPSSHLSGTSSAPSPIRVYLLDGDEFEAMKRGGSFNSLAEWEGRRRHPLSSTSLRCSTEETFYIPTPKS